MTFTASVGENVCLKAKSGEVEVCEYGDAALAAQNQPLDFSACYESLSKLNESNFKLKSLVFDAENIFIRKSSLNELRRNVIDKLQTALTHLKKIS